MKLPYGLANFHQIRTDGYLYIDKTAYIERLESLPERHILLLRSRRFGKTLFVNLLGWYYDQLTADQFEPLFQGTYIGSHPTPKHNAYLMLTFNFSGINTETLANANEGFTFEVRSEIDLFLGRYQQHFTQMDYEQIMAGKKPNDLLTGLFNILKRKGLMKSVFVTIDEYDHFANNLLSQDKNLFKDLVKTDGYVRPFYEALKRGTEYVVDRIFITGVLPILLDSLTSGFNIAKNKSTDERFNEMFGFTEAELPPILEPLGSPIALDEIRTYYNGYRFSPWADGSVYNSDMMLYYASEYRQEFGAPASMIDPNVVSDYRKIRAILSIGDREIEEAVLTRIVNENSVALAQLTNHFILTHETEFRFDAKALASLLFYMGYLTIAGRNRTEIELRMPNLVLKSLYLDYMHHILMRRAQVRIDGLKKDDMVQALAEGNINPLIELTETLLNGLSNRDYERFDEKYIKVVMLSLMSDINIYIPHSEYEIGADGYVDLYLQAAFEPERSASYLVELKYVKARASKQTQAAKEREGVQEMQKYLQSAAGRAITHAQAYVLIFRKDRCVRKLRQALPAQEQD